MKNRNIRNFSIISHIDHGKSTLADRLLELTGTVEQRKMRSQFLDMMDLEREKGITIKLQPVRMEYSIGSHPERSEGSGDSSASPQNDRYVLNLIDTPGHVDFGYEVSRSLAAVEGAILLVDASQGVQAQTLANLHLAQAQGLVIIPVVNKIDLAHAQIDKTVQEMSQLLDVKEEEIIRVSAKQGINVEKILEAVIKKIPGPKGNSDGALRALIFDSNYDSYKGALAYIRIVDGQIKAGDKIRMLVSEKNTEVIEVGVFKPEMAKIDSLEAGQIGYIATGLKDVSQCRVGDTIANQDKKTKPLSGYQEPKSMVFASFYPTEADDYDLLKDGLEKARGKYIMYIGADEEFDCSEIPNFVELLLAEGEKHADLVLGVRWQRNAYKLHRFFMSVIYIFFLNFIYGVRFNDYNWSQAWSRELIQKINLRSKSLFVLPEIVIRAHVLGYKIREIPSNHKGRQHGKSSLNIKIFGFAFLEGLKFWWYRRSKKYNPVN